MSFTFGATPSTPAGPSFGSTAAAPSFGGVGFGFGAPAPAASGGFSFGGAAAAAPQPAPAVATGGFSFGGATAPAPSAPAPGSAFNFGSTGAPTAAAPSLGAFGAPAPATTTGFSFGGGGLFGAPAPAAQLGGGAFGFQQPTAQAAFSAPQQQQPLSSGVSGSMPYASLPPQYKAVIDKIHDAMMTHQRTMINLKSMGPRPLMLAVNTNNSGNINDKKDNDEALPKMIQDLHASLNTLQRQVEDAFATAVRQREECSTSVQQTYFYAKWPTEAMASRRGVRLTNPPPHSSSSSSRGGEEKKTDSAADTNNSIQEQVREMLNRQMASVDSIERMPSPYFWQVLDDMQNRTAHLTDRTMQLQNQLSLSSSKNHPINTNTSSVRSVVERQDASLAVIRRKLYHIHLEMDQMRQRYKLFEQQRHGHGGENVLERAELEELQRQNKYNEQIQLQFLRTTATAAAAPAPSSYSATPGAAPAVGTSSFSTGAFGGPAPAPAGASSFGSTTFGATPAPSTTPAPAAPGAFSFGTSTAPVAGVGAPSPGFGFGATPSTSSFGATSFAASSTPANKSNKKTNSRNKGRLGR